MAFLDGYLSEGVLQRDTSPPPHLNLATKISRSANLDKAFFNAS